CHAVEIHRVGHGPGVDLNLAERNVVDEAPVGHGRFLHIAQQHESGRPIAGTGRGPDCDASRHHDEESDKAEESLSGGSRLSSYLCLNHVEPSSLDLATADPFPYSGTF